MLAEGLWSEASWGAAAECQVPACGKWPPVTSVPILFHVTLNNTALNWIMWPRLYQHEVTDACAFFATYCKSDLFFPALQVQQLELICATWNSVCPTQRATCENQCRLVTGSHWKDQRTHSLLQYLSLQIQPSHASPPARMDLHSHRTAETLSPCLTNRSTVTLFFSTSHYKAGGSTGCMCGFTYAFVCVCVCSR